MINISELVREKLPYDYCTDVEISLLLGGSDNRRYGIVKRALASGRLQRLRRGLYALPRNQQKRGLDLYVLAGQIYAPSYLSFESALSYHGWIPEAVYTITSATTRRAQDFTTPLGAFSYAKVPRRNAMQGVQRVEKEEGIFFVASPWRAILDYVYVNNPQWESKEVLSESLRIDQERLMQIPWNELKELEEAYESRKVSQFLKRLK